MLCCCGGLCRVENAVRLFHFILTFFIFYVLLTTEHSDLYDAWMTKKYGYFVSLIVLLCLSSIFYLLTSFVDPGYLPKMDPLTVSMSPASSTKSKDTVELSMPSDSDNYLECISTQYCRICHYDKPLRAKHCYVCGRCVRKFDHHCPWMGNCIGERNHRWFWMFLCAETSLLGWGVGISWSGLSPSGSFSEWVTVNSLVFVSLVVTFVSVIIVGLLFLYHTYLMVTGQTTWEQVSRHRILYLKDLQELSNPFNEGCCCNTVRFVCLTGVRDWEQIYQGRTASRVR